jgi:hypothetical protein
VAGIKVSTGFSGMFFQHDACHSLDKSFYGNDLNRGSQEPLFVSPEASSRQSSGRKSTRIHRYTVGQKDRPRDNRMSVDDHLPMESFGFQKRDPNP